MNAFRTLTFLMMTAALLTSCQRAAVYKTTTYQEKTNATLAKMTNSISNPVRAVRASAPRVTMLGVGTDQLDFFSQSPVGGAYFGNSPQALMDTCMVIQQAFSAMTDEAALSVIWRCGLALVSYANPAFTLANRQLDLSGLSMTGYAKAYTLPMFDWGSFSEGWGTFGNQFTSFSQFGFNPNGESLTYQR